MGQDYNGIPANITTPSAKAIASSTNTNPIVLTTTAAHLLTSGDRVLVYDHTVNYNADGIWTATVLSPTTFSIPAAGVGVGGATGHVQSLGKVPQLLTLPSDGDDPTASSVNTPLEGLADRAAFALTKLGRALYSYARLAALVDNTLSSNGSVALAGGSYSQIGGAKWTITQLASLDVVVIAISTNLAVSGTAGQVGIGFSPYQPGRTPPAATVEEAKACDNTIRGYQYVAVFEYGLDGGSLDVSLQAFTSGAGSAAWYGGYTVDAFVLR